MWRLYQWSSHPGRARRYAFGVRCETTAIIFVVENRFAVWELKLDFLRKRWSGISDGRGALGQAAGRRQHSKAGDPCLRPGAPVKPGYDPVHIDRRRRHVLDVGFL